MEALTIIREIVSETDISDIPVKYIAAASLIDDDGNEQVISGDELDDLMARRYPYEHINDVNVLLDFRQLAIDITIETTRLFEVMYQGIKNG